MSKNINDGTFLDWYTKTIKELAYNELIEKSAIFPNDGPACYVRLNKAEKFADENRATISIEEAKDILIEIAKKEFNIELASAGCITNPELFAFWVSRIRNSNKEI